MKHLSLFEKRVLFIAIIVHLICVWFSVGFHHPDEHFQLIEFANYKCGKTTLEQLPWEYAAQMRPGLQPLMVYSLLKPYYALGLSNPFHFTMLLRFISAIVAMFTAWHFHKAIEGQIKDVYLKKAHLVLSLLAWGLVYLHVRFSSENWCALMMAWALIFFWRNDKQSYFLFGLFAGLSVVFRFQALFMLAAAGLWMLFIAKSSIKNIIQCLTGFVMATAIGLCCEYWLYGTWTFSAWNYVFQNVVENKAANYGVEPWYWYFEQIFQQGLIPFSVVLLLAIPIMLIYRPKHIITWMTICFLIGHIVVAHKEFRFLFPLYFFYPFLGLITIQYFQEKWSSWLEQAKYIKLKQLLWKSFWIANSIALLVMITKASDSRIAFNETLLKMTKKPTILIYSGEYNPYANSGFLGAQFYNNPNLFSACIDTFMKDTSLLKGKNVWLFSEHAYPKDEMMFLYAGSYFDSSRTSVIWTKFPKWLYAFNFNGWLERSNAYTLYQLHNQ